VEEGQVMGTRRVVAVVVASVVIWAAVVAVLVYPRGSGKTELADVAVPSVIGLDGQSAAVEVEGAGLTFSADQYLPPNQHTYTGWAMTTTQLLAGRVVAQSPPAGVDVHPGSLVELSVALWPSRG
jgi:beta-lactam-binding protein with PASTA domain